MAKLLLHPIGAPLSESLGADDQAANAAHIGQLEQALDEKVAQVHAGWGDKYVKRVHQKGKMTTWERVERLIDDGTEVFEVGTLVNWGREFPGSRLPAPGAGVVTCFARVHGRWVIVIANDNTVASGAWWPLTPEKIERAQTMAMKLRLPLVYLVDCSGLYLPEQSRSFSGRNGAGHIFTLNARLAEAGVPQIAGVFGDCIAGGGYMPIISDRVYMTESAYMVIAGAALIRGAKSLKLTSLDIGGAEVHVHQSGCADVRVPDDLTAIARIRDDVARLPSSAIGFYRHGVLPSPPRYAPEGLAAVFPKDFRQIYDIEQVLARLVDASLFHEVLPAVGREMVCGLARVSGLWMGFIANRQGIVQEPGVGPRAGGVLYREGIAKISSFARCCHDDGVPLVWLQDISGFDIGVEAERQGLLGYGSNLIYANATGGAPVFTVLLRKASGAGYYAMSGMPYEPVVQLSTPITRLAVMEGRTLAIAAYNSKLDDDFEILTDDPDERAAIERGMAETAARIESDMDPVASASRMDTDEVVSLSRLRAWLECLAESAWQSTGHRRTKNPRIWSVHDLEVLTGRAGPTHAPRKALADGAVLQSPAVGHWVPELGVGAPLVGGMRLGVLWRAGASVPVVAPDSASGVAVRVAPSGSVEATAFLVEGGEGGGTLATSTDGPADADAPAGVVVVRAETDGTWYGRPEPGEPAFAAVGAAVQARDTLGLVEVMKTFNPVRSPVSGTVERVLVGENDGVEARQALVWIRPTVSR
jgi:acetyl-CoA carboxylase carboxyltransferase component/biotin carboxyl carrier protein